MSAQDTTPFDERLLLLEDFRSAVWGNNTIFIKESTRPSESNSGNIKYLDFGKHHEAVRSFCPTAEDKKFVVFEEYDAAMNTFKSQGESYRRGACIMGQPGIGKSCFIAYAVVERLREKEPVAVQVSWSQQNPKYLLFTTNAVIIQGSEDVDVLQNVTPIWAFSDSNAIVSIPLVAFQNTSGVRIFQTTSPAEQRWKEWTKQSKVRIYTMDVPSIKEVEDLAFILGRNVERMKTLATKWGCVPHNLLRFFETPEDEQVFENTVTRATNVAVQNPQTVFGAIADYNSATIPGSSLVFFIRPKSKTHRSLHYAYVPTDWLIAQVAAGIRQQQEDARGAFFNAMMAHSQTRSAAGSIFEVITHCFLASGGNFTIQWYEQGLDPDLSLPRLETHSANVDFDYAPPFYWRPSSSNYPGIDGVIFTRDHVYVIQATVGLHHRSPDKGLEKLWESVSTDKKALRWKFVFAGFRDDQGELVSKPYAKKLQTPRADLPVGWLTVPLGSCGYEYFELAFETAAGAGAGGVGIKVEDEDVAMEVLRGGA